MNSLNNNLQETFSGICTKSIFFIIIIISLLTEVKTTCFVCSDVKKTPGLFNKGICLGDLTAYDGQSWIRDGASSSISGPELTVSPMSKTEDSERDNSSDELSSKFRSQCLHSSSSSSSSSSAYEMAHQTNSPGLTMTVAPNSPLLSRSPSTNNPFPISPHPSGHQSGTSTTLPKVRTPLTPRDSIQLVKKHYSQPQPSLDRLHQLNVNIDIMTPSSASSTLKNTGTTASPFSQLVEETDIDDGLDCMDGVVEGTELEEPSQDGVSFLGLAEELEQLDPETVKPPTPPLHRLPSWVQNNLQLFYLLTSELSLWFGIAQLMKILNQGKE